MKHLRWLIFIGLITVNAVFSFSVNGGRITNKFGGVKVHIIYSSEENIEEFMRVEQSEIRIDDRGSDLTDRFKYKVHALMGDYDPPTPDTNNERIDGNILSALLNFPCKYDFNVVGKADVDSLAADEYANQVKNIISGSTGNENVLCRMKPRGRKYIKLTLTATVESSAMITDIFNQISDLENTVMRF